MPAVLGYPKNEKQRKDQDEEFDKERKDRGTRFKKHWDYYYGDMPEPLVVQQDKVNDNVILPKIGQVEDKCVSFLLGPGVTFDVSGDGQESPADKDVKDLWSVNRGDMLQHKMALSGGITGHIAGKLEPVEGEWPKIVNINPANLSVAWDASDVDRVLWYRLEYAVAGAIKRIDYVKGVATGEFDVNPDAEYWTELVYTLDNRSTWELQSLKPWPWEFAPIVDWQNQVSVYGYYGMDDIRNAIRLNDAINLVMSMIARILKGHASPRTIGLGFELDDIVPTSVTGLWAINKTPQEASVFNLEMQSDLSSSLSFAGILGGELWESVRMLDPQSMKDKVGQLTNFGLKVLYKDALDKTETKRQLYGEGLELITKNCFTLAGKTAPETITVVWPDALPEDAKEETEAIQANLGAGLISKQTARERLGYDNEQELTRISEEETTLGENVLGKLARGEL